MAGVRLYRIRFWFERDAAYLGLTNANGTFLAPSTGANDRILALSDYGQVMAGKAGKTIIFGPSGTIRIHLSDGHGAPIAKRDVRLFPTKDGGPLVAFVVNRAYPNQPDELNKALGGKTDENGDLRFDNLPRDMPFSVTIDWPPVQPIVLKGAVRTGNPIQLDISTDCSIGGRVFRLATGQPVKGAHVALLGPGYHNQTWVTVTDAHGFYRFANLPPGNFTPIMQDRTAMAVQPNGLLGWIPQAKEPNGTWNAPHSYWPFDVSKGPVGHADFGLIRAAHIVAQAVDEYGKPKLGVSISLRDDQGGTSWQGRRQRLRRIHAVPGNVLRRRNPFVRLAQDRRREAHRRRGGQDLLGEDCDPEQPPTKGAAGGDSC